MKSGATLTISDCTFNGSFNGSVELYCGGFVGCNAGTVSITDCLCAPSNFGIGVWNLYSFCNDRGGSSTLTRAYRTFNSNASVNQGTRVYTEAPATPLTKRMTFGGNTYYAEGDAAITGVNDAYGYTGSSLALPTAGVRFDGAALDAAHYDVVFRNSSDAVVSSLDVGTYTVTVTGKGDYAGSVSKTFTVTVGDGSLEHPYPIGTPAEWDAFAAQVTGGNNYSGKYVRLTADISGTTMAGDDDHSFNGTFLGGGHTLTVDISGTSYIAPFRSVNGATISDLTVAGSVSSNGMYAATLVGASSGSTHFTNCHSTATLNCTHNGYSYDGGFVGQNYGTLTFDRCSFKGRLLGTQTYRCGGFVGLNQNATANFTDCLFAPAEVTMGTNGSGTFVQPGSGSTTTFTRTYCTTGTFGGKTFVKGKDGEGDFFVIATEEDLCNLSTAVNAGNNGSGKRFVQTADIDLSSGGNFTPIGIDYNTNKRFSGTYDGGHHAISGLKVSTSSGNAGLFGELYNGTVKNVRIMAPSVTCTKGFSGAVVGRIRSGTVTQCITINPTISGGGGFESGAISGLGNCTNSYYYGGNQTTSGTRVYKVTLSTGLGVVTTYSGDGTDANGARISSGTYAGYYAAEGKTVTLAASDGYTIGSVSYNDGSDHALTADANGQYSFTMPAADVTVTATLYDLTLFGYNEDPLVDGSADHPYIITTEAGWNQFCDALEDNTTWNCFIGKTVKLGNSFSVTRTAGSSGHDFCGTFDGQRIALAVSLSGAQYVAPFFYVKSQDDDHPATIQNLVVDGTVTASGKFAAGIAGGCNGKVNITNCLVRTTISSSVPGDGTHGGLVGVFDGGTLNITGCAFTGKLLSIGSDATTKCGGIVGYSHVSGTAVNITNSLYAPATLVGSETEPTSDSKTFLRSENTTVTITNSYYTRTLGDAQGTTPYIYTTKPTGIGTEGTTYNVSGITAYTNGIKYNGEYYTTPPDPAHFAQDGDEYTIKSATGWDVFCDLLGEGETFIGKTVKLGNSISVTRMAGSNDHRFMGTFDGQGNTLTVSYVNTDNNTMTAPFSYVDAATIQNLVVDGSITGSAHRAAGIIGETSDNLSHITNCVSSVNISGGRYTAGFSIGGKVAIEGCVFNGKIVGTQYSGGFVGWSYSGLAITNCLFAPQEDSSISGGTFYYNGGGGDITPTNSYYTTALGTAQGTAVFAYTSEPDGIGAEGTTYDVSGITAYGNGIKYGTEYYTAAPSTLNLTAHAYDDNNWTTFYCGHTGYKIDDTENAWAYTATYSENDKKEGIMTMHKLGKVIPKNTAVIIVGEDNNISLTANTAAAEYSVDNNLHGVDVRTKKSTLGTGTFYVLSQKGDDFGFFEYTDEYMPARKAYLLVNGGTALARELTMVFDEETGIRPTPGPSLNGGEWYDLSGRKLDGKPTKKGLYINNGKKVVIK